MAPAAIVFRDLPVPLFNADRLFKISGREIKRMPESVDRLGLILSCEVMRGVAVIATRGGVMSGFDPPAVLVVHNMAVGAGLRVVAQIRISLRVNESIDADSDR